MLVPTYCNTYNILCYIIVNHFDRFFESLSKCTYKVAEDYYPSLLKDTKLREHIDLIGARYGMSLSADTDVSMLRHYI